MHICLEFLPELLSQPSTRQILFGARLAAALAREYPVQRSMEVGRHVIALLRRFAVYTDPTFDRRGGGVKGKTAR